MRMIRLLVVALAALLAACQSGGGGETIAQLRSVQIALREEPIEGGLEKAMEGYRRFLTETPESALTPAAIRRLADLKVEREYGYLASLTAAGKGAAEPLAAPGRPRGGTFPPDAQEETPRAESQSEFEKRTLGGEPAAEPHAGGAAGVEELEREGAREAIALYMQLLDKYPRYEGNDQVLYQMSRAYEELGQAEEAMAVMQRMVDDFPRSRYLNEVQFRRAEYFFTHRQYLEAEGVYRSLVDIGAGSSYYELALYKLGWTFYKQELYEEGLQRFVALLDHKVASGYDFAQTGDELERKRVDDTFRVVSQSFSYLQGADSVMEYFGKNGKRSYEDRVYSNLGEFYFEKRRYADAAAAYNAFVSGNPFHAVSPQFHMRVIEIHIAGGFPTLVIEAKKSFARNYGLKGDYWKHFDPAARPEVLGLLKANLTDLAHHYHALYQDPGEAKEKGENFQEALQWYGEFLASFPQDPQAPAINYQVADLLLENRSFAQAALEYEKTAYGYPGFEKAPAAGYAAVYAYREQLRGALAPEKDQVKRETVRSSLRFAATFPQHEKAALVLGAAADDLYELKEHEQALAAARNLIATFPAADPEILSSAWTVAAHACYELQRYAEAEAAYLMVLALIPAKDPGRAGLVDNLAASVYKLGEQANAAGDHRGAAEHFLRVGRVAAASKIRPNAEYDAAVALMQLKDWTEAAAVLARFRELFPGHELQPEVTRKMAYLYREDGRLALAASEYERVESEFKQEEVRREALVLAAELHRQSGNQRQALAVYRRFIGYFPEPVEVGMEMRQRVSEILKAENDRAGYLEELEQMVKVEEAAGKARTPRTRFLAGSAALVLAERDYERFAAVRLVKPFESNLRKKKELMKASLQSFNRLVEYRVGEVTAAATFYLADSYAHFSTALTQSERPDDLDPQELQEYELALEEQAFPFEEKAITVHEKNLELISVGVYNGWVDRSLGKLAKLLPVRYDKPEAPTVLLAALDSFTFEVERPAPPPPAAPAPEAGKRVGAEVEAQGAPAAGAQEEAPAAAPVAPVAVKEEVPPAVKGAGKSSTPGAAKAKAKKAKQAADKRRARGRK